MRKLERKFWEAFLMFESARRGLHKVAERIPLHRSLCQGHVIPCKTARIGIENISKKRFDPALLELPDTFGFWDDTRFDVAAPGNVVVKGRDVDGPGIVEFENPFIDTKRRARDLADVVGIGSAEPGI